MLHTEYNEIRAGLPASAAPGNRRRAVRALLLAAALFAVPAARAQQVDALDSGRMHVTRAEIQALLERFEQAARSDTYSPELRARAKYEADLIRGRLEEGDFQVGDQVALIVEGEPQLSSTFAVRPGRVLTLPVIGDVPLSGVMRSEIEGHLVRHLGRYIKNPVLQARTSIRISITGEVRQPGYYVVPAEALLSDAIMVAGGPAPSARLSAMRIERGGSRVWGEDPLQQAIVEGRTLDQMSLRAGDQIVIPGSAAGRAHPTLQLLTTLVPIAMLSITALAQIF